MYQLMTTGGSTEFTFCFSPGLSTELGRMNSSSSLPVRIILAHDIQKSEKVSQKYRNILSPLSSVPCDDVREQYRVRRKNQHTT